METERRLIKFEKTQKNNPMRQNHILKILLSLVAIGAFLIHSCEEDGNNSPICTISNLSEGDTIKIGNDVDIQVEAEDEDGNVEEVRLYINDKGVSSTDAFPYNFQWRTQDSLPGDYTIKTVAIDNEGAKSEDQVGISLVSYSPTAAFTVDTTEILIGGTVHFTDQSTKEPQNWLWQFGDGDFSSEQHPSKTYNSSGSYSVTLSVSNQYGSDEMTKENYIHVYDEDGVAPDAGFSAYQKEIASGGHVRFVSQSTGMVDDITWDFGDGNTSDKERPVHTYEEDGTYTVTLTVSNPYGSDTEEKANFITVDSEGSMGVMTDSRDGKTYNTVTIGDQVWMAENLNYEMENSWWYNHDQENGELYGRLYNWEAAMNACPDGWHLPNEEEWKTLAGNVDSEYGPNDSEWDSDGWQGYDVGKNLKSEVGWKNEGNGTNKFGFTALPGGIFNDGEFGYIGTDGMWWSSSESTDLRSWRYYLRNTKNEIARQDVFKSYRLSVRCVKINKVENQH